MLEINKQLKILYYLAIIGGCLIFGLSLPAMARADEPEDNLLRQSDRRVGFESTEVTCLAVKGGTLNDVSATVTLEWEGQIDEAYLVLMAAGSEGGHSLYVNGQRVGAAPVQPDDFPCQPDSPSFVFRPQEMIPIPAEILVNGANEIVLTNDANINDDWTAAQVYLEIHGVLSGPVVIAPQTPSTPSTSLSPSNIETMATVSGTFALTSSYELAQGKIVYQTVYYQIPASYTGSISTPLLIGAHGYGSTGQWPRDYLAAEADSRGWLLAAPDMHNRYYTLYKGERAFAWVGAQHDIIDTVEYMLDNYNVDTSRIYITGGSMGGQTTAVMAAKYPDIFAAAVPWKPITDLADWYDPDLVGNSGMQTRIANEAGGTPTAVPFEYQRRSAMWMPQNSRLIPIKIWHDVQDLLVPIYHARDLRDAINAWSPSTPVTLIEVDTGDTCTQPPENDPNRHCYNPPPSDIFNFLAGHTLSSQPPISLTIRTDESKPYYWLNFSQTGGDHWSEIEVSYNLGNKTVTAMISDTQPLTVAFNLGSTPIAGIAGITQPGMGLPTTTYLVNGGGNYKLENYTSGHLTTTLTSATNPFSLTISAIVVEVSANPSVIEAEQVITSTITAVAKDQLNNPAPNGTIVAFSSTSGIFLGNGSSAYTTTITGGQGQATATLVTDGPVQISASVESVMASTTIAIPVYLPIVIKSN